MTYSASTIDHTCIFCDIANGRMTTPGPLWEDDEFMAFLSIDPNTEGFTCVIPKAHFGSDVLKMPIETLTGFMAAIQRVGALLDTHFTDVGRVAVVFEGMGIDHAHAKLIPMHGTESLKSGHWVQTLSGERQWFDTYKGWVSSASGPMADPERLSQLASRIRATAVSEGVM